MDTLLSAQQFVAFLFASVLITLAPGPDNLMVLGLGMARGSRQGMAFGLGCALGCLNHTLLAALGVSALIAASQPAFTTLKVIGGAYLLWLGIQAIRHAGPAGAGRADSLPAAGSGRLFLRGLIANTVNPKVILFFLAFLPQFVDAARPHAGWQIVQFGLLFTVQAAVIFATIGWFAGSIGRRLAGNPGLATWLDRLAGGIFVLIGARLIAEG